MSEANKLLLKEWFEQVWNQKSEEAIDRMLHTDGKIHGFPDADSTLVGPESFKAIHRSFCGAFPDIHVNVKEVIAEGDLVAGWWTSSMTHLGDHLGFPASGRKGVLTGSSFAVIRGNQIVEGWNQLDIQALFLKLRTP